MSEPTGECARAECIAASLRARETRLQEMFASGTATCDFCDAVVPAADTVVLGDEQPNGDDWLCRPCATKLLNGIASDEADERGYADAPEPPLRDFVIRRLIELPPEIAIAEEHLLELARDVSDAKQALATEEAFCQLDTERVTGKNKEQRDAQVHLLTVTARETLALREQDLQRRRIQRDLLTNELASLRACSRLLAGGGE